MRKRRAIVVGAALGAALWPVEASAGVVVRTDSPTTTRTYWIARVEDLRREMAKPGANLKTVLERFGLLPINGLPLRTKANVRYRVIPQCNGEPKPPGELADGGQPSVTVNC